MMRPPANQRPAVDQLTNQKQRLPPLIELIEPTPPLCRSAPIFGLTGLDDAEFDLDSVSDDLNPFGPEDPRRGSVKRNEDGSKLKKVLRESAAIKSEPVSEETDKQESDPDSSLLIPLLSLAIIILITLALGTFRLFYTKFYKDKEESLSR